MGKGDGEMEELTRGMCVRTSSISAVSSSMVNEWYSVVTVLETVQVNDTLIRKLFQTEPDSLANFFMD